MKKYIYDKEKIKNNKLHLLAIYAENEPIEDFNSEQHYLYIGETQINFPFEWNENTLNIKRLYEEDIKYKNYVEGKYFLAIGEYVKDNKILYKSKPNYYSEWIDNEWVVNLDLLRKYKRNSLKNLRTQFIYANIIVKDNEYQMRKEDIQNFIDIKAICDLVPSLKSTKVNWILADNSIIEITYEEVIDVYVAWVKRKGEVFTKFSIASNKLKELNTEQDILGVVI